MSQQPFYYPADDKEYISYLESQVSFLQNQLLHAHSILALTNSPQTPEQQILQEDPQGNDIQFVPFNSQPARSSRGNKNRTIPLWKRQLDSFISAIPPESKWDERRRRAGIDTPAKNRLAIQLMLGRTHPTMFVEPKNDAVVPHTVLDDDHSLVSRGYRYAELMGNCVDDRNLTASVAAFQRLIFVSYCVVMLEAGIPKDITNDMMRRYFQRNNDDKTLERYRHGATWVNKCMRALLNHGWGHKSWEIFLLEKRSPTHFGRIADNDAQSFKQVATTLGKAKVPVWENGWIPYCIPCIVQHLTGDAIGQVAQLLWTRRPADREL